MKLYVTRDNINHRSKTVNKGDVIEEEDRNHIGALQSVGCQIYKEEIHGKLEKPKPAPKKKAAKKAAPTKDAE